MEPISIPTLHTDRLTLTAIEAAHSRGVFELWSHPDVCRYSGQVVDHDGNGADARVDKKELISFSGVISKIDGDRVQFHIEKRFLDKDQYVECKFAVRSHVLPLDRGEEITVYGDLSKVGDAVKFENCYRM